MSTGTLYCLIRLASAGAVGASITLAICARGPDDQMGAPEVMTGVAILVAILCTWAVLLVIKRNSETMERIEQKVDALAAEQADRVSVAEAAAAHTMRALRDKEQQDAPVLRLHR